MISHVSVCLLAHEEKGLISDTFRHTKWEYSFLGLDRKGWIAAVVGVVGMCVNCQDCEAVGKMFAALWEKACLFPLGCEWLFHRHERQFSTFP